MLRLRKDFYALTIFHAVLSSAGYDESSVPLK